LVVQKIFPSGLQRFCELEKNYLFRCKVFNEGFKEKILVKNFFWRTHYLFGNIFFWIFGQILPNPKLFVLIRLWFSHYTYQNFFGENLIYLVNFGGFVQN